MRHPHSLGALVAVVVCVACADPALSPTRPSSSASVLGDVAALATITNVAAAVLPVPSGSGRSEAIAVNDRDEIVGSFVLNFDPTTGLGDVRLTMWPGGGPGTDLGNIGQVAVVSRPEGINNRSEIVGLTTPGAGGLTAQAFVWDATTGLRPLGIPPGVTGAFANDINNQGQIAGGVFVGTGRSIAEWPNPAAIATVRPIPFGWPNARASALNDLGDIVGWSLLPVPGGFNGFDSFFASGATVSRLGFPPGLASALASSVNDFGVVTVSAHDFGTPAVVGGFLWNAGAFTPLTAPIIPGSQVTSAFFINNVGDVLGRISSPSLFGVPAVLQADGSVVLLDPLPGAISTAVEMNVLGTVAGFSDFPNGSRVATFWMIPANPVANIVGLSSGVAALASSSRLPSGAATTLRAMLASAASQVPSGTVTTTSRTESIASAIRELQSAIRFVQRVQRNEGLSRTIAEPIVESIEVIVRALRR